MPKHSNTLVIKTIIYSIPDGGSNIPPHIMTYCDDCYAKDSLLSPSTNVKSCYNCSKPHICVPQPKPPS